MDNKCPKCSAKLKITYIKPTCPYCGCDINYYDMENRLERDAQRAEAEFQRLEKRLSRIKAIFKRIKAIFKKKKNEIQ